MRKLNVLLIVCFRRGSCFVGSSPDLWGEQR